jgi:hypothetical protein
MYANHRLTCSRKQPDDQGENNLKDNYMASWQFVTYFDGVFTHKLGEGLAVFFILFWTEVYFL